MKIKYFKGTLLGIVFCVAQQSVINAQEDRPCTTTEAVEVLHQAHPELIQQNIEYNKAITQAVLNKKQQKSAATVEPVYIIPIVFHIIHVNGSENISDAQVFAQVAKMNEDWRKRNADTSTIIDQFRGLAADTKVEYRLAQFDPNGNCTNGIDRIYSHKTFHAGDDAKLNQWPRDKYLNVWTVSSIGATPGVGGYAYYPADVAGPLYPYDGVILLASVTNGTSRVLSHEIGHCFSLQHVWGNNNNAGTACGDDLVEDTPITKGHPGGCDNSPVCEINTFASPYYFNNVTLTSGTVDTTHLASTIGGNLGQFTATGVSSNSTTAGEFSYTNWDLGGAVLDTVSSADEDALYPSLTGSINTSKYYEVTVAPVFGYEITLSNITFNFKRSATGVRSFAVRSSKDGFTNNLPASVTSDTLLKIKGSNEFYSRYDTTATLHGATVTLGGTPFINDSSYTPITFRFYGWNAEDAAGTFSVDTVKFAGTAGKYENTQNYMEYASCPVMFTYGQKDRIRSALESTVAHRNNLWSAANLAEVAPVNNPVPGTGVPLCAPTVDFYANHYQTCVGGSVTFTKQILETITTPATSVSWNFGTGASPATSTSATPTVVYSTPGMHDVTLTATNTTGSNSTTKTAYIRVDPVSSDFMGPYSEPFESTDHYFYFWQVENLDASSHTFGLCSTSGYSGSHSVKMNGFGNYGDDVDNLISPAYNLNDLASGTLTFRCAAASAATTAADANDALKVYSSIDCGATWSLKKTIPATSTSGAYLINNGYHPESYVPAGPGDWALQSYTLPTSLLVNNVRFKFEYTSGNASNNVYLDDINIDGVVGIDENKMDPNSFTLYPNPTNQSTTIAYHLNKKASTKIELIDILGKKIWEATNDNQSEGDYSFIISKQELNLNSGIYFIKLSFDSSVATKKLIVQ